MKHWIGIATLTLLIGLGIGYGIKSNVPPPAEIPLAISQDEIINEEIEWKISTFLYRLVEGNIREAQSYTRGNTYQVLESNKASKIQGDLIDFSVNPVYENKQFAEYEVHVTVETTHGKDRKHYLYSLWKENKQWMIYDIEDLPSYFNTRQDLSSKWQIPKVIEQYLDDVSQAQWTKANLRLTGKALQEASQTASFLPKNLKTTLTIKKQEPIVVQPKDALVYVEYLIQPVKSPKKKMQVMFRLEQVDGEWKINQITSVQSREAS